MSKQLNIERMIFFVFAGLYLIIFGSVRYFKMGAVLDDLIQIVTLAASVALIVYAIINFKFYKNTLVLLIAGCLVISRVFWAVRHIEWMPDYFVVQSLLFNSVATISAKLLYIIIVVSLITYFRPSRLNKWVTPLEILINLCYGIIFVLISTYDAHGFWIQDLKLVFNVVLDVNSIFLTFYLCKKFQNAMSQFDRILLISSRFVCLAFNFLVNYVPNIHIVEPIYSFAMIVVFVSFLRHIHMNGKPVPLKTSWYMSIHKNFIVFTFLFPLIMISMSVMFHPSTQWLVIAVCILIIVRQVLIGIEDHFTITRFTQLNEHFDGVVEQQVEKLLVNEQKYQSLCNQMEESLVILDLELEVVRCNPALESFLQEHLKAEHLDEGFRRIMRQHKETWDECISQALQNHKIEMNTQFLSDHGKNIHLEVKVFPYQFQERILGILILMKDQTEFVENQRCIQELAYVDQLTNLWTRHYFFKQMESALGTKFKQAALLFMDLNRFKDINDRNGHQTGDAVLKEFANRLQMVIGDRGTICRFSGDEFLVLLPDCHKEEIEMLIHHFLQRLHVPYEYRATQLALSASIGVSCYPEHASTLDELVHYADLAMYHVKQHRHKQYYFYDVSLHDGVRRKDVLQREMLACIPMNQLELYYQPLYDIMEEHIIGVEALLRWTHPELGSIPPMEFIPIAESNGMILEIGNWVIREACQQLQRWQKDGVALPVSINVSIKQMRDPNFVPTLMSMLKEYKIDSSLIKLEVTESIAISDTERATRMLHELNGNGISIYLDDFGTGYSSLSYLMTYPIDNLKIDRAFIKDISSPQKVKLIDMIVYMAQQLGINVVAEGVETREQLEYLRNINCRFIQGYYFSQPLPVKELTALLSNYKYPVFSGIH